MAELPAQSALASAIEVYESNHAPPAEPSVTVTSSKPVLYLAYGSNLSAQTFLGRRHIRPLSQINVVAPSLRLTFDLPGMPYVEPCFANSAFRDDDDTTTTTTTASSSDENVSEKGPLLPTSNQTDRDYHKLHWHKGLVGVAYELTPSDFAHVIATEGGGMAYQDVVVPCYALDTDPSVPVPEHPSGTPMPVHTLLAPPGRRGRGKEASLEVRAYAQASARYLNLLTTGAAEHALPLEYQAFLQQIRPFTVTSRRQRMGKLMVMVTWGPIVQGLFAIQKLLQNKKGRSPEWFGRAMSTVFSTMWRLYDTVYVRVFGDGERTEGQ